MTLDKLLEKYKNESEETNKSNSTLPTTNTNEDNEKGDDKVRDILDEELAALAKLEKKLSEHDPKFRAIRNQKITTSIEELERLIADKVQSFNRFPQRIPDDDMCL